MDVKRSSAASHSSNILTQSMLTRLIGFAVDAHCTSSGNTSQTHCVCLCSSARCHVSLEKRLISVRSHLMQCLIHTHTHTRTRALITMKEEQYGGEQERSILALSANECVGGREWEPVCLWPTFPLWERESCKSFPPFLPMLVLLLLSSLASWGCCRVHGNTAVVSKEDEAPSS